MGSNKTTVRGDENIQMEQKNTGQRRTLYQSHGVSVEKFAQWLWDEILVLLVDESRKQAGRKPSPTYGIVDSQSVKTVYHSNNRGVDGGKKIMGNLLAVCVHAANNVSNSSNFVEMVDIGELLRMR